jgi:hypothetical protein
MRMLMKVQIPTEAGNEAIRSGSLPRTLGSVLEALKAEAAYFIAEDGMRTGLIFFDMADSTDIPSAAEPLFMEMNAQITMVPAMNAEDMQAGVAKAIAAMG